MFFLLLFEVSPVLGQVVVVVEAGEESDVRHDDEEDHGRVRIRALVRDRGRDLGPDQDQNIVQSKFKSYNKI